MIWIHHVMWYDQLILIGGNWREFFNFNTILVGDILTLIVPWKLYAWVNGQNFNQFPVVLMFA